LNNRNSYFDLDAKLRQLPPALTLSAHDIYQGIAKLHTDKTILSADKLPNDENLKISRMIDIDRSTNLLQ